MLFESDVAFCVGDVIEGVGLVLEDGGFAPGAFGLYFFGDGEGDSGVVDSFEDAGAEGAVLGFEFDFAADVFVILACDFEGSVEAGGGDFEFVVLGVAVEVGFDVLAECDAVVDADGLVVVYLYDDGVVGADVDVDEVAG